jgi:hypothetical protein
MAALAGPAHAVTTVINPPPSEVRLRVGAAGAVTTVTFTVTAAIAGNGTAIVGAPNPVLVRADARETGCVAKNATLTVTTPANLVSGADTIPYSTISWTTSDADIAAGTYLAPGTRTIATFANCHRVTNNHTFQFSNAQVYPQGTYNGVATYTLTMP